VVAPHPDDEFLGPGATMNLTITETNAVTHLVIQGEGIGMALES
jgi:LmbE family N-acetylglucosaminyl deacetylase